MKYLGYRDSFLNPQLISELQQLRSTPVGNVASGAINKRVELDGKVVLQSDENGKVIVNSFLQPELNENRSEPEVSKVNNQVNNTEFANTNFNHTNPETKQDKILTIN
ncbi:MAG: hypothetical protein HC787_10000 [Nostocaceae cyanobacterium CSU_2_110]|nr:hypothetical protein [Nostocaceae cyanobacterium CSU_2_110]